MSEYWKSLPRKFCEICKCWFADNKASVQFHEKGKKHQENVEKRIKEIQKKGLKEFKAQKKYESEMEKIEAAALKAFKKDLESNPELAAKYQSTTPPPPEKKLEAKEHIKKEVAQSKKKSANLSSDVKPETVHEQESPEITSNDITDSRLWYEAVSEDGYTYYWNHETSESRWEPPEEGYISLEEQKQYEQTASDAVEKDVDEDVKNEEKQEDDNVKNEEKQEDDNVKNEEKQEGAKEPEDGSSDEKDEDCQTVSTAIGPQPRPDPYGQWVTVEHKPQEYTDLELPAKPEIVEVHIPLPKEYTFKIKEKVVGSLKDTFGGTEGSTFKKRKNLESCKRNIRQRLEDS